MADDKKKDAEPTTANPSGAATTPSPANKPGPDHTISDTSSQPEIQGQDRKTREQDNKENQKQAELDQREKELEERERRLEQLEGNKLAAINQREEERQLKTAREVLESGDTEITLLYEHANNTPLGLVKYGPGKVKVPSAVAEDLERRDAEHNAYQVGLHQRREDLLYSGRLSGAGK